MSTLLTAHQLLSDGYFSYTMLYGHLCVNMNTYVQTNSYHSHLTLQVHAFQYWTHRGQKSTVACI